MFLWKKHCSPFYSLKVEAKGVLLKIVQEFVTEVVTETQSPESRYKTWILRYYFLSLWIQFVALCLANLIAKRRRIQRLACNLECNFVPDSGGLQISVGTVWFWEDIILILPSSRSLIHSCFKDPSSKIILQVSWTQQGRFQFYFGELFVGCVNISQYFFFFFLCFHITSPSFM